MTTKPRQTILDIAVAASGSAHTAIQIAIQNGLSLSDELTPGSELSVPGAEVKTVIAFFATTPAPATAIDKAEQHQLGGIGYMGININFLVS